jgi:hypothetical protein
MMGQGSNIFEKNICSNKRIIALLHRKCNRNLEQMFAKSDGKDEG